MLLIILVRTCAVVTTRDKITARVGVGEADSSGGFNEDHVGNFTQTIRSSDESNPDKKFAISPNHLQRINILSIPKNY